nr:hypothetical protein BaRGS_000408 [Batillaria attramentaria]
METPYGGRLTYNLPGGNPLVIHLKNREQIRHKKRWSQVMYMYYLLSYRLLLNKGSSTEKRRLADNTFLLALDGDVDFYPDAVQLLVDRMRRNHHVGAACGRIHPIGSGVMVWYQKFEYAVSHWLQKAAEHVFGCVLCSPGCFSLFRGSALMEDNVLKRYTKVAERARHAVQYDMGEDRWLCTLLLQQGKRVEYAAAADALTFCPDDFGDFYIQRRRWTPSTMANILDVLSDWRHITKVNSSVSLMFIAYQTFLFVSSVLTPGTIFLLILGAINTAYPTLPLYGAMLLNLIPVLIFIILCFVAKTEIQIAYATILSMLYSLVMMIVLVGLLRQMAESGMCSVTAIFFVGVAGIFLIAAFLHPQEFLNILFGLLYFLAIPATSMLLIFFAVANLNVVSWGTRDSGPASGGNKKKKTTFQGVKRMLSGAGGDDEDVTSDYTFSFGNLFRCICCPVKKSDDPVMERFGDIENALYELQQTVSERSGRGRNPLFRDDDEDLDVFSKSRQDTDFPKMWFEEEELGSGIMDTLPHEESVFWNELIEKYLKPIPRDPQKEAAMANDLTKLRNKAAMLFFLGNALFVTIIFILESVAEYTPGLTIELPCDTGHVGQKLEPISVTFTIIFGILLVLQLFGMLQHRFSTFVHIVASTSLRSQKRGSESENYALNKRNYFYDLTVNFVQPGGVWDDDSRSYLTPGSSCDAVTKTGTGNGVDDNDSDAVTKTGTGNGVDDNDSDAVTKTGTGNGVDDNDSDAVTKTGTGNGVDDNDSDAVTKTGTGNGVDDNDSDAVTKTGTGNGVDDNDSDAVTKTGTGNGVDDNDCDAVTKTGTGNGVDDNDSDAVTKTGTGNGVDDNDSDAVTKTGTGNGVDDNDSDAVTKTGTGNGVDDNDSDAVTKTGTGNGVDDNDSDAVTKTGTGNGVDDNDSDAVTKNTGNGVDDNDSDVVRKTILIMAYGL